MLDLAVVPLFVNAGAALLPALVAGAASFLSLLLRPGEVYRLARRRPLVPVAIAGLIGVIVVGGRWLWNATPAASAPTSAGLDWAELGERIVLNRQIARPLDTAPIDLAELILGGDAERCGHQGRSSPLGLKTLWTYGRPQRLADGQWEQDNFILASPIARGGVVYAASSTVDLSGNRGWVFAVDADTGRQIWKAPLPTLDGPDAFRAIVSSPALSGDGKSILIGQGLHADADCALLCLDAATGAVRWRLPTPLHLESSPAVKGDLVVIGAGAIEDANHKPIGDPGFVLAARISDGQELWRYPLADPECSPAIGDDGVVYIGGGLNGNCVVALRSESDETLKSKGLSRLIWRAESPYPVTGAVTLAGDLVIVGAGNSDFVNVAPRPAGVVLALNARTGEQAWMWKATDAVLGHVSHRDGRLFCPVRDGEIAVLEASTGRLIWCRKVAGKTPLLAGCAVTATHLYVPTQDGFLHILDAAAGEPVEAPIRLNEPGRPGSFGYGFSSPMIVGDRLYVGSETGGLRCLVGTN